MDHLERYLKALHEGRLESTLEVEVVPHRKWGMAFRLHCRQCNIRCLTELATSAWNVAEEHAHEDGDAMKLAHISRLIFENEALSAND